MYLISTYSQWNSLSVPDRNPLLLVCRSPGRLLHAALMPSMSSRDEVRRRLWTLSTEPLRGSGPPWKALPGSRWSVSREQRLVEDWAAGDGGSRSCSIRASVSDCMQLSLDGRRNSLRGTSSLLGWRGQRAGSLVSGGQKWSLRLLQSNWNCVF